MSRYCDGRNMEPILNAAQHWKDVGLLSDGSVFDRGAIWTLSNLEVLDQYFVNQPDRGKEDFFEKLRVQLDPTTPGVKQLAAEMLWLMFLCPLNIRTPKRRKGIKRVWEWSGDAFPEDSEWLGDDVLVGAGSGGQGFLRYIRLELVFFIRAVNAFKSLTNQERNRLLSDGWEFARWLEEVPECDKRQLRHMLLFLLFPDNFERTFGGEARRKMVQDFLGKPEAQVKKLSALEIDRNLLEIRKQKEEEYGTKELDFYTPPLSDLWGASKARECRGEEVIEEAKQPDDQERREMKNRGCRNLILYGPPGTGKTHKLRKLKKEEYSGGKSALSRTERYEFVAFHQAYSYEDFVEGIRPVQDQETGEIGYRVVPGAFKRICQRAKADPDQQYAIFIDEINRGNIAKIFGELITLIEEDKRATYNDTGELRSGTELTLPYSGTRFGVPGNLDVYGAMNTADRSIALLDTALRRRFEFEELMPKADLINGSDGDGRIKDGDGGSINLRKLLEAMNRRIRFLLNRDMMLGHAYFFYVRDFNDLKTVLFNKIIPLLQEYFYEDWHKIQLVFRDVGPAGEKLEPQIVCHKTLNEEETLGFDHDDFDDLTEYRVIGSG